MKMKKNITIDILVGTEGARETCELLCDEFTEDIYVYGPNCSPEEIFVQGKAFLLVIEYGKRIPDEIISKYESTGGAVFNVHRANPREYTGASVLNHQILDCKNRIDVSLIRIRPGEPLDGGEVIDRCPVNIQGMLYPEVVAECRLRYRHFLQTIIDYKHTVEKTIGKVVKRRSPEDSELELTNEQIQIIRAADNERFPAFLYLNSRKIILKAYPEDPTESQTES
jgi:methionyl-tRNA formyltransferase